jgi:Meiotically up-regulated gene 113
MGIYIKKKTAKSAGSRFWYLYLERKGKRGICEKTTIPASEEMRPLAQRVYEQRMAQIAAAELNGHMHALRPSRPRLDQSGWTYIYFVSDGTLIKIGRAVNVQKRLQSMQTASVNRLTVLATLLAHISIERLIHRRFKEHRVSGEWFRPNSSLETFIGRIASGVDVLPELLQV